MPDHPVGLGGGCHLKDKARQLQTRSLCVTVLVLSFATAQRLRKRLGHKLKKLISINLSEDSSFYRRFVLHGTAPRILHDSCSRHITVVFTITEHNTRTILDTEDNSY